MMLRRRPDGLVNSRLRSKVRMISFMGAAVAAVFVIGILPASTTEAADGPVAYYPFNGGIRDSSGFGNHAVTMGAVPTADRFGNANSAYVFNGVDYLQAPDSDSLDINSAFTMDLWFRVDGIVSTYGVISGKGANSAYSVSLYYGGSTICNDPSAQPLRQIQVTVGTASNRFIFGPSFPCGTGQWHHIAVTVRTESDGDHTAKLFVNGVFETTMNLSGSFANNTSPLGIGKDGESPYHFAGAIDDLRLYDRELNPAEIAELHDVIFVDGMESGSRSAWQNTMP